VPAKKQESKTPETPANLASFEGEFERLGLIVEKLETGSVSLEEMLKLYEEGVGLAGRLSTLLQEAELRVEKLAKVHEEMLAQAEVADDGDVETYLEL
jgi:exodeoxyribonuclease VII small subunit